MNRLDSKTNGGECGSGGETSALIFNAILERAPTPVLRLNPDLPAKCEDIINRALEKDRDLRYQSAREMRSELMRLKRDTDSGRNVAALSVDVATTPPAATSSISATPAAHVSGSSSVVEVAKQHKRGHKKSQC